MNEDNSIIRKLGLQGGVGAYIHHHRSRYEAFGTRFNEDDYISRKPKDFTRAHQEAKEKIENHSEFQRARIDRDIAKQYTEYYNSLKPDKKIKVKNDNGDIIEKNFQDFVYEVVYEIMKTQGIKSVEQVKNIINNSVTMRQKINDYEKKYKKNKNLPNEVLDALKIINESLNDANKGILDKKNIEKIENIQSRLNRYLTTKRSNKNVRSMINEALELIQEDFYLNSTVTSTVSEYVAAMKGMIIEGGVNDIISQVEKTNKGKKTKTVEINNISPFVDKIIMRDGITDEERDVLGTHRQRGMNTAFSKSGKMIRRVEAVGGVGIWEIDGDSMKYSKETQQTTDFEISYEFLPNSIKKIIDNEKIKLDKLSFSMKNYDANVKLVQGTALDTILNSAPIDFINHYYNLISSKRDSVGFIKNPIIKNGNLLNNNLILANQLVKSFLILRGLLGIRNRADSSNSATDFLVTVNKKGEYQVFSTRWILYQITNHIEALENLLDIKGLPKTGFKNQWIGTDPSWEDASKRVAGVLAAAHAAKLTLHLRTQIIPPTLT